MINTISVINETIVYKGQTQIKVNVNKLVIILDNKKTHIYNDEKSEVS